MAASAKEIDEPRAIQKREEETDLANVPVQLFV
jgi:hypothetical protein